MYWTRTCNFANRHSNRQTMLGCFQEKSKNLLLVVLGFSSSLHPRRPLNNLSCHLFLVPVPVTHLKRFSISLPMKNIKRFFTTSQWRFLTLSLSTYFKITYTKQYCDKCNRYLLYYWHLRFELFILCRAEKVLNAYILILISHKSHWYITLKLFKCTK